MHISAQFLSSRTLNCNAREAWLQWTTPAWLRSFFGSDGVPELIACPFEIYTEQSVAGAVRLLPGKLVAFALPILKQNEINQLLVTFLRKGEQLTTVVVHRMTNAAETDKAVQQALRRFTDWFESGSSETY